MLSTCHGSDYKLWLYATTTLTFEFYSFVIHKLQASFLVSSFRHDHTSSIDNPIQKSYCTKYERSIIKDSSSKPTQRQFTWYFSKSVCNGSTSSRWELPPELASCAPDWQRRFARRAQSAFSRRMSWFLSISLAWLDCGANDWPAAYKWNSTYEVYSIYVT